MNQDRNKEWDVIVIGAGIAGLTASIYMAREGLSVLLLDKGGKAGGRADSTEMSNARVNLGPHALYKSALPILREVGVSLTGASPKPNGTFVFKGTNGHNKALPFAQLFLGSFLNWNEKMQLFRFYSRLRKADSSALRSVSLQAYLDSQITSPRVQSLVLALVRVSTYCNAPDLLSAGAAIEQLQHGQVLYVDGGWQSIVSQLTEQALQAGVSIRASSPAAEIAGAWPHMTVTLKDGTQLAARSVLSTAGPTETLTLLHPALPAADAARYEQLIPVRAACLDLVVKGMPDPKTRFALGADFPWYYSNHSAVASFSDDPELSVVHAMKYLPVGVDSDPQQDKRELEEFLDLIQPGWRSHVVQQRFLPRMLVSHAAVTAENGGFKGRPGPAVEGRPGLYAAGDWVGDSGMLANASLTSAKDAAHCIIARIQKGKEGIHRGA